MLNVSTALDHMLMLAALRCAVDAAGESPNPTHFTCQLMWVALQGLESHGLKQLVFVV